MSISASFAMRFFCVFAFCAAACSLVSCGSAEKAEAAVTKAEAAPGDDSFANVTDFKITRYNAGIIASRISAKEANISEDQVQASLTGVRLLQFNAESGTNVESASVVAQKGRYFLEDSPQDNCRAEDLILRSNVKIKSTEGFQLQTSKLHYRGATGEINCPAPTEIVLPIKDSLCHGQGEKMSVTMDKGFGTENVVLVLEGTGENQAHFTMKSQVSSGAEEIGELQ